MPIDSTIVRALAAQSDQLSAIAFAAKAHWGYPDHWLAQWRELLTITPAFIREHDVYVASSAAGCAGFYALAGAGPTLILEHLWVLPQQIGTGVGRLLFAHALRRAAERNASQLEIEADPNAEGFYRHMGAQRIGEQVSEIDGQRRVLPLLLIAVRL